MAHKVGIEDLLNLKDESILIFKDGELNDVVIGVPHHAPLGVNELPCKDHKDSDENAGVLGLYISKTLNCRCIIASNYFIDSNKTVSSDYSKRLKLWSPKILVEIHGHGGKSANYDIEISSGNQKRNDFSIELASRLRKQMQKIDSLNQFTLSGRYEKIHFKASNSKTITSDKWLPFHIELPFSLRSKEEIYQPFCEILANSISEILETKD